MSKHRHHQVVQAEAPVEVEPETQANVEDAQKEQQAEIEAELNAIADQVEAQVEAAESPASFKEKMKTLRERQKEEMKKLKENIKAEREKAKAEGKVKTRTKGMGRPAVTGKVISEVDEPISFDNLALRCDEEYVKLGNGHKPNIREARMVLRWAMEVVPIVSNGSIQIEGDVISRNPTA